MTADRVFVSIAVSQPDTLAKLPGAITAAKRMAAWAQANGYATVLVHDEEYSEVTVELLRQKITEAIQAVTEVRPLQRLIVFFAGHGAALAVGDQYWLLSHWEQRPSEAIKVSSLQRILEYYGPVQVAIIGDACQEFSSRFIDVVGSPVLDKPSEEPRPYELDQFFAVDVGKQAFMIKASDDQGAFCVFTEVLLDGLEGDVTPEWLEPHGEGQAVTSQSLARFLAENVAREAGRYGIRMTPRPRPGFYTDRIYTTIPPPSPGGFYVGVVPVGSANVGPQSGGAHVPGGASPKSVGGPVAEPLGSDRRPVVPSRNTQRITLKAPARSRSVPAPGGVRADVDARRHAFESKLLRRADSHDSLNVPCGIVVSGAEVLDLVVSGTVRTHGPNHFEVVLGPDAQRHGAGDALLTLANGRTYCICLVLGFVCEFDALDDTTVSLLHRARGLLRYRLDTEYRLLSKAHAGLLQSEDLAEAAGYIRRAKHRVLTLGCIAAQFYDLARDTNSLRSMASFYVSRNQPIPLDIVLYGGGTLFEVDGQLCASIPPPETPASGGNSGLDESFQFEPAPSDQPHPVAGRIPWMRHAWGALATARYDTSALDWEARAFETLPHLASGIFTNVRATGRPSAAAMAAIAGDGGPEHSSPESEQGDDHANDPRARNQSGRQERAEDS